MLITTTNIILKIIDQDDGTCLLTQYSPLSPEYQDLLPLVTERFTPQESSSTDSIYTPL